MMSCKLNHNLICFDPQSLSKSLGTDLKLLTNKNVQFHWTLLLGPSSKMALNNNPNRVALRKKGDCSTQPSCLKEKRTESPKLIAPGYQLPQGNRDYVVARGKKEDLQYSTKLAQGEWDHGISTMCCWGT
jgi:hypothetical protein